MNEPTITQGTGGVRSAVSPEHVAPDGYELLAEVGRGGMGIVYRARDLHVERDVAVKLLSEHYAADSPAARRFVDEARITAQLQHPGIPAVFEVGTLSNGRPFLAMKLIKGDTLDDLLRARPEPAADRGRFVAIFEQVCQAVGYAHSRHVIHRDLKPQNVMVGAFGEVQVMDWGLAKAVDPAGALVAGLDPEETWGTQIVSARPVDSATEAGILLGTPAFMAPEQAAGAVGQVGPRADVFGLGALLCVILTGKPPYTGDGESVRLAAVQGKIGPARERLDASGADPELVALCKRCLAPEPADRPADGGEVAAAIHALRVDAEARARQAELDRERAAVREAERRKRRRVILIAAVAAAVLIGVTAWVARQRAEDRAVARARAEEIATSALDQAEVALAAGRTAELDTALAQAATRLDDARRPDLSDRYDGLARDRAMLRELDAISERRWSTYFADREMVGADPRTAGWFAEAFRLYGIMPGDGDAPQTAERVRTSRISVALVAALNEWFFLNSRRGGLKAILESADPDPVRNEIRAAVAADRYDRVRALADTVDGGTLSPGFAVAFGMHPAVSNEVSYQLMRAAWEARPDSFALALRLGTRVGWQATAKKESRDLSLEAAAWHRTAVALRPQSHIAFNNLGLVLAELGDRAGAEAALRRAQTLDPAFFAARENLLRLEGMGGRGEGLAAVRRFVDANPNLAAGHNLLGRMLLDRRENVAAVAPCRRAVELDPDNPQYHHDLGFALQESGDSAAAIVQYRASSALRGPDDPIHYCHAGWAMRLAKNQAGAAEEYAKAIEVAPLRASLRLEYALIMLDLRRFAKAAEAVRKVIDLEPWNATAHERLGIAQRQMKDYPAAVASSRRAVELEPRVARHYTNLARAISAASGPDAAVAALRKLSDADLKNAAALTGLAYYLRDDRRDHRAAADTLRESLARNPKAGDEWHSLAHLLSQEMKDHAAARDALQKVIELKPTRAVYRDLVNTLLRLKDTEGALTTARELNGLWSDEIDSHRTLALALRESGQFGEAKKVLATAEKRWPIQFADPRESVRFESACVAARLGNRSAAHQFLTADLAAWARLLAVNPKQNRGPVKQAMAHWLKDENLASVRDAPELARLPDAERSKWDKLWSDVRKLLADATASEPAKSH